MYIDFSALSSEPSPEEHEAALMRLANGLIHAARAWRDGTSSSLTDPNGFVRNINARLAALNAYVRRQDERSLFGEQNFADFSGRDDKVSVIIRFSKGIFSR